MSLLAIKFLVTPLMILAASLAGRRWGDSIGGWLVGLPLTSGPVAAFLALEQGPEFAAQATAGTLAGAAAQAAFCLAYAWLALYGWPLALAGAMIAFVVGASLLQAAQLPHLVLFLAALAALAVAVQGIPREAAARRRVSPPWWDIPARMAIVTVLVVGLTSMAPALGPRASGILATFPLFSMVLSVFAQHEQGPAAARAVLRGTALSLFGFAVFFYVLSLCLARTSLPVAFAAATHGALLVQATTLRMVRRSKTVAAL
jgi:hypothetical protein